MLWIDYLFRLKITVDVENKDSDHCEDWLLHVQSARMEEEQNIVLTSRNGKLICVAKKRIKAKAELLMWYGDELLNVLGANDQTIFIKIANSMPFFVNLSFYFPMEIVTPSSG